MADRYPDEPSYSCPIIDDIQNALDILHGQLNQVDDASDFDYRGIHAQLEKVRDINDRLREDARNFHNIALRAKEVLEEL